jgi:general secretion pathway protein G
MRTQARKAFTLVEILIVVVILGILAAIVIPQFTSATESARSGNLAAQLKSIQNQIELFKAKTGAYPTLVEMQAAVTKTGVTGADWGILIDGDYLKTVPSNPACPPAVKSVVSDTAAATCGWVYEATTGTISATYFDEATSLVTPTTP